MDAGQIQALMSLWAVAERWGPVFWPILFITGLRLEWWAMANLLKAVRDERDRAIQERDAAIARIDAERARVDAERARVDTERARADALADAAAHALDRLAAGGDAKGATNR